MSVTYDAPPQRSNRQPGPWGAVAVAIVAVTAFAFYGSGFEQSDQQVAGTTTLPPISLADHVPGLTGTMHALIAIPGGSRYVRWPADRLTPISTDLTVPVGRFNADATHIAAVVPLAPDGDRGDLWVGPPDDLGLAVTEVTGFAWHDRDPLLIAATRQLGGVNQLWVGQPQTQGYLFRSVATLPAGTVVEAFGDWGLAVRLADGQEEPPEVLIFDHSGSLIRQYPGIVVGQQAGDRGGVVIYPGEGADPVIGFLSGETAFELPAGGKLLRMAWSPEGDRIAVSVEDGGVRLVRVIEGPRQLVTETRIAAQTLRWSPDGRFLIMTTTTGRISVLDTNGSAIINVPIPGEALEAMVTPG